MTQKQLLIPAKEPQIQILDNQAVTTSRDVADFFEKDHKEVLRKIQAIDLPKDFTQRNFTLSEYRDVSGKMNPCYNLTRDGFMFLVMGFTGKKANLCKISYINKFNEMEAQLFPKRTQLDTPSTKEDRKPLTNLVSTLVDCAPFSFRNAWHMVHAHMGGKHAEEFTLAEVQTATEFVQEQINLHTVKPAYTDYPDAQLGLITELAMQGARKFSLFISLGDKKTRNTSLITKGFKADIYLFEENAIEPKGVNYCVKFAR